MICSNTCNSSYAILHLLYEACVVDVFFHLYFVPSRDRVAVTYMEIVITCLFIFYRNGKNTPACSIRKPIVLLEKEIEDIYELYIRRKQGHAVSKQAADVTRNQVYWYGIFSDMGL